MSVQIYCDKYGLPLPEATSSHSLLYKDRASGMQGTVDIIFYKWDTINGRRDGRPDLCMACLKILIEGATKR